MKHLLFITSMLFSVATTYAQKKPVRFGLKAGLEIGRLNISPPLATREIRADIGFVAGGIIEIPVKERWSIRVEPLFNEHSSTSYFKGSNTEKIENTLFQLSLPVQAGYKIFPDLTLLAGVSANYNFRLESKAYFDIYADRTFDETETIVPFQPGVLGGFSYNATRHIFVEGRYHRMITNTYKEKPGEASYHYQLSFAQVTMGYRF